MFQSVIHAFSALPEVEAIALGGSRSGSCFDEKSDYDIYLYCVAPVSEEIRREILEQYSSRLEIGNHFWEMEDNGTFRNGIDFDILYRNLDDFVNGVAAVAEKYQAQNAYTTCMWYNLMNSQLLFDRNGRLAQAQQRFRIPYPEALRQNILDRGMKLLHSAMPAYELQSTGTGRPCQCKSPYNCFPGNIFRCSVRSEPETASRRKEIDSVL